MPLDDAEPRLPVAIITGFLGSGKTTLVNHILAQPTGLRIAVMVNELGDIAIDGDLIVGTAADMVELANGCICCSINGDLVAAVSRVLQRRAAIDYLVIETSGVADPLPIALTFVRQGLREMVRVDSILAVADAASFGLDPFGGRAAPAQLRYADFVLLNKCDLVDRDRADAVEAMIRAIAGAAKIIRTAQARVALPLVLATGRYRNGLEPGDDTHDHLAFDGFEAVSFASEGALSAERFQAFLQQLPANIFRAKGLLRIDDRGWHLFHLVGRRFTIDHTPAGFGGRSRLVLIGQRLDAAGLRAQLAACFAPAANPAAQ
jgi:G3E family GTPase